MRIRNGNTYAEAHEGDGIKLIFPTGPDSRGRVQSGIAPIIMGGPVVGVVVRK